MADKHDIPNYGLSWSPDTGMSARMRTLTTRISVPQRRALKLMQERTGKTASELVYLAAEDNLNLYVQRELGNA